jgi:ketosteroid isomerase-like protein
MTGPALGHVGLVVKDAAAVAATLVSRLGLTETRTGDDEKLAVHWRWLQDPRGAVVELVMPTGPGAVRDYLDRHGQGLHHLSFEPVDFDACMNHIQGCGGRVLGVDRDHDGWAEFFLDPAETGGALIQVSRDMATSGSGHNSRFAAVTAAWESKDIDRLPDLYDADAIYIEPVAGTVQGRDRIVAYMTKAIRAADYRFDIRATLNAGGREMCEWEMEYTTPAGPQNMVGATVIESRNGKIYRHTDYFDTRAGG